MKKINVFLIMILLVSLVYASIGTIDSFTGETNPFTTTFIGGDNQTFFLDIPRYADVKNISINLTNILLFSGNTKLLESDYVNNSDANATNATFVNMDDSILMNIDAPYSSNTLIFTKKMDNGTNYTLNFNMSLFDFVNGATRVDFALGARTNLTCDTMTKGSNPGWPNNKDCDGGNFFDQITTFTVPATGYNNQFFNWIVHSNGSAVKVFNLSTGILLFEITTAKQYLSMFVSTSIVDQSGLIFGELYIFNTSLISNTSNIYLGNQRQDCQSNRYNDSFCSLNITHINTLLDAGEYTEVGDSARFNITFDKIFNMSVEITNSTYEFGVEQCTDPNFNFTIINFTYFDQENGDPITVDHNYDLSFTVIDESVQGNFSGKFSDSLCSNVNLTERNLSYDVTGQLTLSKTLYGTKLFDITSPINLGGTVVDQALFLIKLNESTTIAFTWLTTAFQPIDGTMIIYECVGDGTRTLLSSTPIIDSDAAENLELLTKTYSYDVVIDGEVFQDNTSFTKCHIETSDTRRFFVRVEGEDPSPTVGMYSIPCDFTPSGANQFFMEWGENPQSDSEITGCISGFVSSIFNTTKFHEECSISGSLNSSVSDPGVPYTVTGTLFQNGISIGCGNTLNSGMDNSTTDLFGLMGIFSVALLIIAGAFLFASDGESMVIGSIIGLFAGWFMGIISFGWGIISMIIFLEIIIIMVGRYSRKKT